MRIDKYLEVVNLFRWSEDKEKLVVDDIKELVECNDELSVNTINMLLSYESETTRNAVLKYM